MGESRFGAHFDDIVYGAYVRARDIMEIPASGRLFMGQRHVAARTAVQAERTSLLVEYSISHMTAPQGRLLQDDPSPSSLTAAPWFPMAIVSGVHCGFGYPCCSRCEGRGAGEKTRIYLRACPLHAKIP